jgi:microcystin-dependent protein
MLFAQSSAPAGWTKDSTYNDYALRVTTGTASSGGSVNFSSIMTTQSLAGSATISGTGLGPTTLKTSNLPTHQHGGDNVGATNAGDTQNPAVKNYLWSQLTNNSTGAKASSPATAGVAWTGGSHSHSISTSSAPAGVSFSMAVKYLDVIIATRN